MSNLLEYENRYYDLGYDYIIGLDEAGRGPMAGELFVAGVIFPFLFDLRYIHLIDQHLQQK